MRVVVVGSGAVGQVFAWHLRQGGARVVFRVRRPEAVRRPFHLVPLRGSAPVSFDVPCLSTDEEIRAFTPDVVLLTVPSDALREPWLASLLVAAGSAQVVGLEPSIDDAAIIRAAKPDVSLTLGIIAFIAYHAPLEGEATSVAVYLPPFVACPFEGPFAATFSETLRRGGMRAVVRKDLARTSAFGSPVMGIAVTALRAVDWSFARAFSEDVFVVAGDAIREAAAIQEKRHGLVRPRWLRFAGKPVFAGILRLGRWVLPLPLEPYLRVHFTKVGAQTQLQLRELVAHGRALSLPVAALEALQNRADARRNRAETETTAPVVAPGQPAGEASSSS